MRLWIRHLRVGFNLNEKKHKRLYMNVNRPRSTLWLNIFLKYVFHLKQQTNLGITFLLLETLLFSIHRYIDNTFQ